MEAGQKLFRTLGVFNPEAQAYRADLWSLKGRGAVRRKNDG
jgi:hypothetical protein